MQKTLMILLTIMYCVQYFIAYLLEEIEAIPKVEGKKAAAQNGSYQENITVALLYEYDHNITPTTRLIILI